MKTFAVGELGEDHTKELIEAGKFANRVIALIATNALVELVLGQEVHQLGEHHLAADKRNWGSLVPDLYRENESQGREILNYFVDQFTNIAEIALPIINDYDRWPQSPELVTYDANGVAPACPTRIGALRPQSVFSRTSIHRRLTGQT